MTPEQIEAAVDAAGDKDPMIRFLEDNGYTHVRKLPNGEYAAIYPMIFTTGLLVGLDRYGYRTRFCYENRDDAVKAIAEWDGERFPPYYWIKQKPENILNPVYKNETFEENLKAAS